MEQPRKKTTKELARELGLLRERKLSSISEAWKKKPTLKQSFHYLIIIDFESTCWERGQSKTQEIIEFPAVLLNTRTGEIENEFHHYTQPQEYPTLSDFCRELTGITQDQVDIGIPLSLCLRKFARWLTKLYQDKNICLIGDQSANSGDTDLVKHAAIVTWSDWDLGVCLHYEVKRKQISKAPSFNQWIDLRATYTKFYGRKPKGLNGALQDVGIKFEGREHSGLHDSRNTASLAWRMIRDGCIMNITKTLSAAPTHAAGPAVQPPKTRTRKSPGNKTSGKKTPKKTVVVAKTGGGCADNPVDDEPPVATKSSHGQTRRNLLTTGLQMRNPNVMQAVHSVGGNAINLAPIFTAVNAKTSERAQKRPAILTPEKSLNVKCIRLSSPRASVSECSATSGRRSSPRLKPMAGSSSSADSSAAQSTTGVFRTPQPMSRPDYSKQTPPNASTITSEPFTKPPSSSVTANVTSTILQSPHFESAETMQTTPRYVSCLSDTTSQIKAKVTIPGSVRMSLSPSTTSSAPLDPMKSPSALNTSPLHVSRHCDTPLQNAAKTTPPGSASSLGLTTTPPTAFKTPQNLPVKYSSSMKASPLIQPHVSCHSKATPQNVSKTSPGSFGVPQSSSTTLLKTPPNLLMQVDSTVKASCLRPNIHSNTTPQNTAAVNTGTFRTPQSSSNTLLRTPQNPPTQIDCFRANGHTKQTPPNTATVNNNNTGSFRTPQTTPMTLTSMLRTPQNAPRRSPSHMKATPPLCKCGRRSKRRLVQNPGPNEGRWFFSCVKGAVSSVSSRASGCGYFQWEHPNRGPSPGQRATPAGSSGKATGVHHPFAAMAGQVNLGVVNRVAHVWQSKMTGVPQTFTSSVTRQVNSGAANQATPVASRSKTPGVSLPLASTDRQENSGHTANVVRPFTFVTGGVSSGAANQSAPVSCQSKTIGVISMEGQGNSGQTTSVTRPFTSVTGQVNSGAANRATPVACQSKKTGVTSIDRQKNLVQTTSVAHSLTSVTVQVNTGVANQGTYVPWQSITTGGPCPLITGMQGNLGQAHSFKSGCYGTTTGVMKYDAHLSSSFTSVGKPVNSGKSSGLAHQFTPFRQVNLSKNAGATRPFTPVLQLPGSQPGQRRLGLGKGHPNVSTTVTKPWR